jgi:hypothetical protein
MGMYQHAAMPQMNMGQWPMNMGPPQMRPGPPPQMRFGAPPQMRFLGAPHPTFGKPQPTFGPPQMHFGAPRPNGGMPHMNMPPAGMSHMRPPGMYRSAAAASQFQRPPAPHTGPMPQPPLSVASAASASGASSAPGEGTCAILKGVRHERWNCQRVLNLASLFGNVVSISVMARQGAAYLAFQTEAGCTAFIKGLKGRACFGQMLEPFPTSFGENRTIFGGGARGHLPDGSPAAAVFRDASFFHFESGKTPKHAVGRLLVASGLPAEARPADILSMLHTNGGPVPQAVERQGDGVYYLIFNSISEALEAASNANHGHVLVNDTPYMVALDLGPEKSIPPPAPAAAAMAATAAAASSSTSESESDSSSDSDSDAVIPTPSAETKKTEAAAAPKKRVSNKRPEEDSTVVASKASAKPAAGLMDDAVLLRGGEAAAARVQSKAQAAATLFSQLSSDSESDTDPDDDVREHPSADTPAAAKRGTAAKRVAPAEPSKSKAKKSTATATSAKKSALVAAGLSSTSESEVDEASSVPEVETELQQAKKASKAQEPDKAKKADGTATQEPVKAKATKATKAKAKASESAAAAQAEQATASPPTATDDDGLCVVLRNTKSTRWNCQRVLNLASPFGNVAAAKVAPEEQSSFMVFETEEGRAAFIQGVAGRHCLGDLLDPRPSALGHMKDAGDASVPLHDGTPALVVYQGDATYNHFEPNDYLRHEVSKALLASNLPPDTSAEDVIGMLQRYGAAAAPLDIEVDASGVLRLTFASVSQALDATSNTNHGHCVVNGMPHMVFLDMAPAENEQAAGAQGTPAGPAPDVAESGTSDDDTDSPGDAGARKGSPEQGSAESGKGASRQGGSEQAALSPQAPEEQEEQAKEAPAEHQGGAGDEARGGEHVITGTLGSADAEARGGGGIAAAKRAATQSGAAPPAKRVVAESGADADDAEGVSKTVHGTAVGKSAATLTLTGQLDHEAGELDFLDSSRTTSPSPVAEGSVMVVDDDLKATASPGSDDKSVSTVAVSSAASDAAISAVFVTTAGATRDVSINQPPRRVRALKPKTVAKGAAKGAQRQAAVRSLGKRPSNALHSSPTSEASGDSSSPILKRRALRSISPDSSTSDAGSDAGSGAGSPVQSGATSGTHPRIAVSPVPMLSAQRRARLMGLAV